MRSNSSAAVQREVAARAMAKAARAMANQMRAQGGQKRRNSPCARAQCAKVRQRATVYSVTHISQRSKIAPAREGHYSPSLHTVRPQRAVPQRRCHAGTSKGTRQDCNPQDEILLQAEKRNFPQLLSDGISIPPLSRRPSPGPISSTTIFSFVSLYSCVCRFEVTVTSLHPPRLCRTAVFSVKPTFLSLKRGWPQTTFLDHPARHVWWHLLGQV